MIVNYATHRRLCAARDLLCSPEQPSLSIDELAARVRLSPFHLTRQFAAVFGETPHQYRTAARITRAKALLAGGELSVTEVCLELGFTSLGSFSALFSGRVGESPLAYQRRVRRLWSAPGVVSPGLTPGCFSLMCFLPPEAAAQFSRSTALPRRIESGAEVQ